MIPVRPMVNWDKLEGGDSVSTWLEDRQGKLDRIADWAQVLQSTAHALEEDRWKTLDWSKCLEGIPIAGQGRPSALQWSHPDVLAEVPCAADWYVSLAGYAMKTLGNVAGYARERGLVLAPKTIVQNLTRGTPVAPRYLLAFSTWVNGEISGALAGAVIDRQQALLRVSMILGGRVVGQGQNARGNEAVVFLKALLLRCPAIRLPLVAVQVDGAWAAVATGGELPPLIKVAQWRLDSGVEFDFRGGGDRPDIRITGTGGEPLLFGEVKGRKDVSNTWESWMPQIADHVRTWTGEAPTAWHAVFGTLFSKEMVEGLSSRGTTRVGLRGLYDDGLLDVAYNLSNLELDDEYFDEFRVQMESLISG